MLGAAGCGDEPGTNGGPGGDSAASDGGSGDGDGDGDGDDGRGTDSGPGDTEGGDSDGVTPKGKPIGAARSPSIVAGAKTASRWKAVGAAGAVLTVGSAAVGIIATIENQKRRMEFLRDSVESYQNWYATTNQGILDMSAASKEMEDAINALLEALGFSTPEELEAFLGGAVEDAGELQGALKTATRMLCADPPLAAADVSTYTGLPLATVQRRAALIAQDPGICQVGG